MQLRGKKIASGSILATPKEKKKWMLPMTKKWPVSSLSSRTKSATRLWKSSTINSHCYRRLHPTKWKSPGEINFLPPSQRPTHRKWTTTWAIFQSRRILRLQITSFSRAPVAMRTILRNGCSRKRAFWPWTSVQWDLKFISIPLKTEWRSGTPRSLL